MVQSAGWHCIGHELEGPFTRMPFSEQVIAVGAALTGLPLSPAIGESYGAYLLLHALADLRPRHRGPVLLFSPVLGPARDQRIGRAVYPPRASKLLALADAGAFPAPQQIEIHIGADDVNLSAARQFCEGTGADLYVVDYVSHRLPLIYQQSRINDFLRNERLLANP